MRQRLLLWTALLSSVTVPAPVAGSLSNGRAAEQTDGRISGTVIDEATGLPIPLAGVSAYRLQNGSASFAAVTTTDDGGAYEFSGLATGTYFVFTSSGDYINEIFDDVPCPGSCLLASITAGTPIAVTAGATAADRNFALARGGRISGTVSNQVGTPLGAVSVEAYQRLANDRFLTFIASGFSDSAGVYQIGGLPAGTYFVKTLNSAGFINEYYDNVQCLGSCSAASLTPGTAVPVTLGNTTPDIDFSLAPGGRVQGTVTGQAGTAVSGWFVFLYTEANGSPSFVASAQTNASGGFEFQGLKSGTYYAFTQGTSQNLINEIYDGRPCLRFCSSVDAVTEGTAIAVTAGATTSGIGFSLDTGGIVSGVVSGNAGGPLAGSVVLYAPADGFGQFVGSASVNASTGAYSIGQLPSGTYYPVSDLDGYINEIHDGIPCLGSCSGTFAAFAGAGIDVTAGGTTGDVDFALDAGGRITGTVRRASDAQPVAGIAVRAWALTGDRVTFAGDASTNASGVYEIGGLAGGSYFVLTSGAESSGLSNVVHAGIVCPGFCNVALAAASGATRVDVTPGAATGGIDVALPAGGSISGAVVSAANGLPIRFALVSVYTVVGGAAIVAGTVSTGSTGVYTLKGLPAGTYYAYAFESGYAGRIYDSSLCPLTCTASETVLNGTPIAVSAGSETTGRNFALQPIDLAAAVPVAPFGLSAFVAAGVVDFRWAAPFTLVGGAATSYIVEVGLSPGATLLTFPTTATTLRQAGVPPGRFFARVRAVNANGIGPPSNEVEMVVGAGGTGVPSPPPYLEAYLRAGRLYVLWEPSTGGGPLSSYVVDVGTASGASNIARLPVPAERTLFTFEPVPAGFYFIRVRAVSAGGVGAASPEAMLVVGDVPSPPPAPTNFAAAANPARTVTIGWTPPRGPVTGYLLEAGSGSGLTDIAVVPLPAMPTTFSVPNVPPGTYYLRLRAVNALGASVASSEYQLIVR